jgi:hypothetical protein
MHGHEIILCLLKGHVAAVSLNIQTISVLSHIACISTGGHTGASHANSNQDVS